MVEIRTERGIGENRQNSGGTAVIWPAFDDCSPAQLRKASTELDLTRIWHRELEITTAN